MDGNGRRQRLFAEQRQQRILEKVDRQQAATVSELGLALKTSHASVRRDLQQLEIAGLLRRTHGGAISNHHAAFEPSIGEKEVSQKREKEAIARLALELIQEGETVMLDAGSTTLEMARQWKHKPGVTVVTNGINVASELARYRVEVVVIGGSLRARTLAMVGPIAERTLAELHIDRLFLAANGVTIEAGITTPNLAEAQMKRTMIGRSREVVLVADHTKFGKVTFSRVCPLRQVQCVITDAGVPVEYRRAVKKLGGRVLLAAVESGK